MKLKFIYIVGIVFLALVTLSCSKMNDLHQPYLDEGEIIYAAKVDSAAAFAGKNRIQFEMIIRSQRIETVRIFWNDYMDSLDVAIGNKTGSTKLMLENMAEKGYIFKLVSIDKYGNPSLPFEVTGKVYGDKFQTTVGNRSITSKTPLVGGVATINWAGPVDYGIRCDLVYKNLDGVEVTRKVPMSAITTSFTDMGSDLKYRTLFLPEPTAIDTFYTDFKAIVF